MDQDVLDYASKMVRFETAISRSRNEMVSGILDALDTAFGYKQTAFCSLLQKEDGTHTVYSSVSNAMNDGELEKLKAHFVCSHSSLLRRQQEFAGQQSYCYTYKSALDEMTLKNKALRSKGYPYELNVIAHQKNSPLVYCISVLKSASEGDFSDEEQLLFKVIGETILVHLKYYREDMDKKLLLKFLERNITDREYGYCVLDENLKIMTENSVFRILKASVFNDVSNFEILKEISPDMEDISGFWLVHRLDTVKECASGKYKISVITDYIREEVNFPRKFLLLLIKPCGEVEAIAPQKSELHGEKDFYELMKRYDMTLREMDVLLLIVDGKSNADITRDLNISSSTLRTHIRSIYSKMDVNSKANLVAKFFAEM